MKNLLPIFLVLFALNAFGESKEIADLRKKAEAGDAEAQFNLGGMYAQGTSVEMDGKEAIKWYRKAADQGVAEAQFNLGLMYRVGPQRKKLKEQIADLDLVIGNLRNILDANPALAAVLTPQIKARELEKSELEKQLPELGYKSNQEAAKWFLRAAKQGYPQAQFGLGVMYAKGQGLPKHPPAALAWFVVSGYYGYQNASRNRDIIAKSMTPEQIAEAQKMSSELLKQIEANKVVVDLDQLEIRAGLWCFEEKPFTGYAVGKHPNGQKISKVTLKDGKRHGLSNSWYENGQKRGESNFKDDKLWTAVQWKPNGEKCPVTNVVNGNGVQVFYHDNGQKAWEETLKDGKWHGLSTSWYENGQKKEELTFKNGRQISRKDWDEDGNPR